MAPVGYLSHRQVGHAKTGGAECYVGRSALRATATDRSRLDGVVEKQRRADPPDGPSGSAARHYPDTGQHLLLARSAPKSHTSRAVGTVTRKRNAESLGIAFAGL